MSQCGKCQGNSVVGSFFSSLKRERERERVRYHMYKDQEEARHDVFDDVEMFNNPVRKQVMDRMQSPGEFGRQQILKAKGVQK